MPLKVEIGGHVLNSHANYSVDHGVSWNNHGIVFLNFCGNPVKHGHTHIRAVVKGEKQKIISLFLKQNIC